MKPTISVIIPAYNAAQTIAEALDTALGQTRPATEILVVDDCSSDETAEVVQRYRRYGVTLLRTPVNGGSAVARNYGISAASGELIAFLDADDLWLPKHLSNVAGLLDQFPEAGLAFSMVEAFGREHWRWPSVLPEARPEKCFWECASRSFVPHVTPITYRAHLLQVGGYRTQLRYSDDFDLFLRLAYFFPFVCSHDVTARYRRQTGTLTAGRPLASNGAEMLSCYLFLREPRFYLSQAEVDRFCGIRLQKWLDWVYQSWSEGDSNAVRYYLDQSRLVDGAAAHISKWRWRLPLTRANLVRKHVLSRLQAHLASLFKTLYGQTGTVMPVAEHTASGLDRQAA